MRKKVLFVPSWYPNEDDPISGVFIEEQAVALSKEFDVAVLLPKMASWRNVLKSDAPDQSVTKQQSGLTVYHEFARPLIPHGPESIDYGTFARAAQKGFKRVVSEWGTPDIIHAHVVLPAGWSAFGVATQHRLPIVLTEHSSPFSMHLGTELSRRLVRETLTGVNQVVAISPALAQQILDCQPGLQIEVMGESQPTEFFLPTNSADNATGTETCFFNASRLAEQLELEHHVGAAHQLVSKGVISF